MSIISQWFTRKFFVAKSSPCPASKYIPVQFNSTLSWHFSSLSKYLFSFWCLLFCQAQSRIVFVRFRKWSDVRFRNLLLVFAVKVVMFLVNRLKKKQFYIIVRFNFDILKFAYWKYYPHCRRSKIDKALKSCFFLGFRGGPTKARSPRQGAFN